MRSSPASSARYWVRVSPSRTAICTGPDPRLVEQGIEEVAESVRRSRAEGRGRETAGDRFETPDLTGGDAQTSFHPDEPSCPREEPLECERCSRH